MEKNFNDRQSNLASLDRYMSTVSPMGDWKNPALDMPLMSRLVQNLYNPKASQANKLSFYGDIIDSFSDINKHNAMAKERMIGMPANMVDVAKELVNDTINTRSESTLAFLNENLRKEFVQAEYMVTGSQLGNQQASERELMSTGITADGICQILSNLTSLKLYMDNLNEITKSILPNVIPLAAVLKQNDPNMYIVLRQLLAATEGLGVVLSILKGLHDGCTTIQPINTVGMNLSAGVQIGDVNTPVNTTRTIADVQNDIANIANSMANFGQHVPARVQQVLATGASEQDIIDLKNIIMNTATPVSNVNAEKFALAVSTGFATQEAAPVLAQAPKNIMAAMFYISKIHADKKTNTNTQTQDIANGFRDITNLNIRVLDNYRLGLSQAIQFDMQTGNANAVMCLGSLTQNAELTNFGRVMLSRTVTGQPQLTKQAVLQHVKTASPYNSQPTVIDIDEFMKSRHYVGNSGAPAARQEILQAVVTALQLV